MDQTEKAKTRLRRPFLGWVVRGVRVAAAGALIMAGFSAVLLRSSMAKASDAAMSFGDELLGVSSHDLSGTLNGDVYRLSLNGQRFDTSNATTQRPLSEVLAYFQASCNQHAGGMVDQFENLAPTLRDLPPGAGSEGFATVRESHDERGFVFCVAPSHSLTTKEKLDSLVLMSKTSDLGKAGDLRYVAAQSKGGVTRVVTVWTHGSFNLLSMFPRDADAPGEDLVMVPRPDQGRRLFSGHIDGTPFGTNVYQVSGAPKDVVTSVDTGLQAAGWKYMPIDPHVPQVSRFYSYGDKVDLVVTVNADSHGGSSVSYMLSAMVPTVSR
jgi:hypothetical protein